MMGLLSETKPSQVVFAPFVGAFLCVFFKQIQDFIGNKLLLKR